MREARRQRTYVSGRMSGIERDVYLRRFSQAEELLKGEGYRVYNPSKWWFLKHVPYRFALAFDLFMMCFCDRVYMLNGWSQSDGATAEHSFARSTGMIVMYEK